MEKTIHEGRNVKRIREMPGIKQVVPAVDIITVLHKEAVFNKRGSI